ncbi:hypothetical protein VTK26DRAFT_7166 [Humicola hyalothermophila]
MATKTALVTGGSGYIGLHVVNVLLEAGWTVHTTVRKLSNEAKVRPVQQLSEKHPGKLKLFEADLVVPGSFSEAMVGCSVVLHVASPFIVQGVKDPQKQLIEPAIEGTRNVLESVNKTEAVKRLVLTSSIGTIYGDCADVLKMENQTLTERYWNETSSIKESAYQYSKTLAEREAWKIAEAQSRWDLVVLNPGGVLGPSLSPASDSGSLSLFGQLLKGNMIIGVPDLSLPLVDVRDVAIAHLKASEKAEAKGRYIICSSEPISFLDVSLRLKKVHSNPGRLPSWKIPRLIFRLLGPLSGISQRWISANIGIEVKVDNSKSVKGLGMEYRPLDETLADYYRAWESEQKSA